MAALLRRTDTGQGTCMQLIVIRHKIQGILQVKSEVSPILFVDGSCSYMIYCIIRCNIPRYHSVSIAHTVDRQK